MTQQHDTSVYCASSSIEYKEKWGETIKCYTVTPDEFKAILPPSLLPHLSVYPGRAEIAPMASAYPKEGIKLYVDHFSDGRHAGGGWALRFCSEKGHLQLTADGYRLMIVHQIVPIEDGKWELKGIRREGSSPMSMWAILQNTEEKK